MISPCVELPLRHRGLKHAKLASGVLVRLCCVDIQVILFSGKDARLLSERVYSYGIRLRGKALLTQPEGKRA